MNGVALAVALMSAHGPYLHGASRVLIGGLPTCGKTEHAKKLTRESWRALWYSPQPEDFRAPGRLFVTVDELERYPDLLADPHTRIVVDPRGDDGKSQAEEVGVLVRLLFEARDIACVFDEVGDYRREAERDLNRLFRRGRHSGIASVLVSQFATDFPLTCRRAASDVFVFAQKHKAELDALAETYGEDFAEQCRRWRKYEPPATWNLSEVG